MGKVQITESGTRDDGCYLKITGLTEEEKEKIEGVLRGRWWMRGELNGKLAFSDGWKKSPDPVKDPEMAPFWKPKSDKYGWPEVNLVDDSRWPPYDACFVIQSLCGYGYSPENYRLQSEKLREFGFVQLRSQRDDNGRFWEIWYLPGLWAAQGRLRNILPKGSTDEDKKKQIEAVVSFLCREVRFGTLDVAGQRAAMRAPD